MSESGVHIVAEIGQAHDGSLGILHSYIDAIATTGADAVKFQMHIADSESSQQEPFRVQFSYADKTRYDYWKRMEYSAEQWAEIKRHCESLGLEFLVSPFSVAAVRLLEELGVKRFKIASGEVKNYLMLDHIARSGKEIWMSTGMSSYAEIAQTLEFLDQCGASRRRVLFQCTTAYPTLPEQLGLNVISEMADRFGLPVGLSDHSGTIYAPLAAVSMGASHLESHVVFDKSMFGPDAAASLTIPEFTQMVTGVRFIEQALSSVVDKDDVGAFEDLKTMFGKTLAVSCRVNPGEALSMENLESKKPGALGIPADAYRQVLGKPVNRLIEAGEFLQWEDLD